MSAAAPKTTVAAVDPMQADDTAHDIYICRRVEDTLLQ